MDNYTITDYEPLILNGAERISEAGLSLGIGFELGIFWEIKMNSGECYWANECKENLTSKKCRYTI
ncbi:hypothetical protein M2145_002708 [Lachnospiraceae bacterium PF1-21]